MRSACKYQEQQQQQLIAGYRQPWQTTNSSSSSSSSSSKCDGQFHLHSAVSRDFCCFGYWDLVLICTLQMARNAEHRSEQWHESHVRQSSSSTLVQVRGAGIQLDLAEQVVDICIAHTSTTTIASYPPCAENYVIVIIIAAEVPASLLLSPATILWPLMAGEMRNENDEGPYHWRSEFFLRLLLLLLLWLLV